MANFNDLEKWGILETINNELLHVLGLKLVKDDNGQSSGCLISDDLFFDASDKSKKETKKKFELFIKHRYYYLKNYLDVQERQNEMKQDIMNKINKSKELQREKSIIKTN